jgi:hypothetical protein
MAAPSAAAGDEAALVATPLAGADKLASLGPADDLTYDSAPLMRRGAGGTVRLLFLRRTQDAGASALPRGRVKSASRSARRTAARRTPAEAGVKYAREACVRRAVAIGARIVRDGHRSVNVPTLARHAVAPLRAPLLR